MKQDFLNDRVIVKVGDITQEKTDSIVNAANSRSLYPREVCGCTASGSERA